MGERSGYQDGEPCWVDVLTPDVGTSRRFYRMLFGWDFVDTGAEFGNYTMCQVNGRNVAALSPPPPGGLPAPPAWNLYLASSDVDSTAKQVERGGGKIMMGPLDIPGSGRMLFGFDPTGAAFGIWQAGAHTGAELVGEPGAMCWAEVNTRDGAVADAFYGGLFGYQRQQLGAGQDVDYAMWSLPGGDAVCGRMVMGADVPGDVPPHWLVFFAVDDADGAAGRATDEGGRVAHGPFDSPSGRIAILTDPHDAVFGVVDMSHRSPG